MINYGVKFDDWILKGIIVLYIVCVNGNVVFCKYCLIVDFIVEFINIEDYKGWSVFFFVVFYGYILILKYLKELNNMMKMMLDKIGENIL